METKKLNEKLMQDLLNEDTIFEKQSKQDELQNLKEEVNSEQFQLLDDDKKLQKLTLLFQEIKNNIENKYQKLVNIYKNVYPEIFSILPNPVLVSKAIIAFGNFENMDEKKLLQFDKKISVSLLMGSFGKNLNQITVEQKEDLFKFASDIMQHSSDQKTYLKMIQELIEKIAPNTAKIAGNLITAQLIAQVGSIKNLANIPSCNIQVIGERQKSLNGLSKVDKVSHVGFFDQHYLFEKTDVQFRKKLVRFLSNNVAKASKIDAGGYSKDGSIGQKMYKEMLKKFDNVIGPKKRERIQPMKAPGTEIKKRRGGKKYRNMKKAVEMTEVKKLKNRIEFGTNFKTDILEEERDIGMLKSTMGRKLKIQKKIPKFHTSKDIRNDLDKFSKKIYNQIKILQIY